MVSGLYFSLKNKVSCNVHMQRNFESIFFFLQKSLDFDFKDSSHVIETALDCLYAKENPDQLDIAGRIMKCLPKLDGVEKALQEKVITAVLKYFSYLSVL